MIARLLSLRSALGLGLFFMPAALLSWTNAGFENGSLSGWVQSNSPVTGNTVYAPYAVTVTSSAAPHTQGGLCPAPSVCLDRVHSGSFAAELFSGRGDPNHGDFASLSTTDVVPASGACLTYWFSAVISGWHFLSGQSAGSDAYVTATMIIGASVVASRSYSYGTDLPILVDDGAAPYDGPFPVGGSGSQMQWRHLPWTQFSFDLSAYAGQAVTLKFTAFSCDQSAHSSLAYIDDVSWQACASPTPTLTSTATRTVTATRTATKTRTPTPSKTLTAAPTATRTQTLTCSVTATSTRTRTASPTRTANPTASATPTSTRTRTPSPTGTWTSSASQTPTSTPTVTATSSSSATRTVTGTRTLTPTSTKTSTSTQTLTATRSSSATATASATASTSSTPTVSPSGTARPSDSATATPSATPSATATGTAIPSAAPSATFAATLTARPTPGLPGPQYQVTLKVFNSAGELVAFLGRGIPSFAIPSGIQILQNTFSPGTAGPSAELALLGTGVKASWDGTNSAGQGVASGTYTVSAEVLDQWGKVTLLSGDVQVLRSDPLFCIAIYNSAGERVRSLALAAPAQSVGCLELSNTLLVAGALDGSGKMAIRTNTSDPPVPWDGLNDQGLPLSSGTYVIKVERIEGGAGLTVFSKSVTVLDQVLADPLDAAIVAPDPVQAGDPRLLIRFPAVPGTEITASVYTLDGRLIASLRAAPGAASIRWDWGSGRPAAGIYFVVLKSEGPGKPLRRRTIKVAFAS